MKFDSISNFLKYCKPLTRITKFQYNIYVLNISKPNLAELNIKAAVSQSNNKTSYIVEIDVKPNDINLYCPCKQENCEHIANTIAYLFKKYNILPEFVQIQKLEQ